MEHHLGFYWPKGTRENIRHLVADTAGDAQAVVDLASDRRIVVQAGGNVGCWPRWLAARFGEVWTFEPEARNHAAMLRNIHEKNVTMHRAALGERVGSVGLRLSPKNIAGHAVAGAGDVPMMTIDSLDLGSCGAIILDVEGYEFPALRGARETLRRFRPVVMVEDRDLGSRIGAGTFLDILQLLGQFGYSVRAQVGHDYVLTT